MSTSKMILGLKKINLKVQPPAAYTKLQTSCNKVESLPLYYIIFKLELELLLNIFSSNVTTCCCGQLISKSLVMVIVAVADFVVIVIFIMVIVDIIVFAVFYVFVKVVFTPNETKVRVQSAQMTRACQHRWRSRC